MNSRSSWPAAAAAAAVLACLPAKVLAERPPSRPQGPPDPTSVVADDSDPWRPDGGLPSVANRVRTQSVSSDTPVAPASAQPVARHESWIDVILRILRSLLWGGDVR
jgi:hypothetical protein